MTRKDFYQQVIGDALDKVHAIGRRDALDDAWREINAQGGYASPDDLEGTAHNKAVLAALDIIEGLGGMDPLQRGKE